MKRKTKLLSLLLAGVLCLAPPQIGKAAQVQIAQDDLISVCNLYSRTMRTSITISSGEAKIVGAVTGVVGTTTKIKAKLTLQKYSNGSWNAVNTYEKTVTTTNCILSATKSVSTGKYRVKGVYTVYKGDKYEKTTQYSSTVSC